jgi:hemerythrin-like domain-containing protein
VPVKRSPELAVLSREHHIALELALRLRRARGDQADQLAADAVEFWRRESIEHFRLEEEFVLPRLASHAGANDPEIARTLSDHADLRRHFAELSRGQAEVEALSRIGELLADHIRFEERVLFPRVEATLDRDELTELGRELAAGSSGEEPGRG